MKRVITTLGAGLLGLFLAFPPRVAEACGGTFCDRGPSALPVDQTGENVLFVLDGTTVEAHIQIQYMGGTTRFAWIVPMPKVPDVSVGSQPLFNALLQGTVPTYGYTSQFDQCPGRGTSNGSVPGTGPLLTAAGGSSSTSDGPTVVFDKVVGSFQVAVLQGGTAQEVTGWLDSNGYQTVPNAPALLQKYIEKSYVFAAIKLTTSADVSEIHPLVFKYPGNEPCVPLQLTAVAAQPDMGVRTFFLGDDREYPSNYAHVVLNPARVDWQTFGSNYNAAVSRAVDSPGSDGHGFVTEYAGASTVVSGAGLYSSSWSAAAFRGAPPDQVVPLLSLQGLASCQNFVKAASGQGGTGSSSDGSCAFNQPLVLPLLEQYLPLPADGDPNAYACLSCTGTSCTGCGGVAIDASGWDSNKFADDLQARVIDPGQHAQALLAKWTYLTRLFTTISPAEMTLDPTFEARPELSNQFVSMASNLASRRTTCCGQNAMILPAQGKSPAREVALNGSAWPPFSSLMPWAEKIERVPLLGDVMTVADNSAVIDAELKKWNASQSWPPAAGGSTCNSVSGLGGAGTVFPSQTSGAGGAAVGNALTPQGGSGCNCSLPGRANAPGLAGLLALLGLGLFRRRRSG